MTRDTKQHLYVLMTADGVLSEIRKTSELRPTIETTVRSRLRSDDVNSTAPAKRRYELQRGVYVHVYREEP